MLLFKIIGFWFFILFGVLINGYLTDSTTTASTDKCSIIISITKDKGKIESSNYPKPYPTDCLWTYIIHIGVGYKLKLVINDLDVDIESGDAFIIEPTTGSRVEIENHSHSKQSPITKESTSEENAHSAIITFLAKDHVNTRRGFSFNYERIEEPNTEKPSDAELPGWIQLYLAGVSAFEFNLMQDHFKEATAKLTKQYIDMKHISNENLSAIENDIIINSMEPCPSSWPWASTCIQLNFSIKLTDNNFELNSEHLKEIWDSHRSSEDFYHLGITEYELPDVEWFIWFWIFLIGFISLVFAFLLVIVVRTKLIHYYFLKLQETKPESSATRASRNWSTQPLSYPFNAENDQRFQFVREYERHVSRPTYSGRNGVENASYGNHSDDAVDDFDSEDEQHIYHSLDYK